MLHWNNWQKLLKVISQPITFYWLAKFYMKQAPLVENSKFAVSKAINNGNLSTIGLIGFFGKFYLGKKFRRSTSRTSNFFRIRTYFWIVFPNSLKVSCKTNKLMKILWIHLQKEEEIFLVDSKISHISKSNKKDTISWWRFKP